MSVKSANKWIELTKGGAFQPRVYQHLKRFSFIKTFEFPPLAIHPGRKLIAALGRRWASRSSNIEYMKSEDKFHVIRWPKEQYLILVPPHHDCKNAVKCITT